MSDAVIRVEGIEAVFENGNGGLRALDELSFEVCYEEFLCILGPSGSGKSTLLRILGGLLAPTAGEVYFCGERLSGPQRATGFVFQDANLMPWRTVLENITLPLEIAGQRVGEVQCMAREMIELVGLEGFEDSLPNDLSGGMAQRVAIARALVYDPEVLLLDEPFGALDAITRERMGAELLRIWDLRRKTVIMVTHSIPEALFLADRVLVLSKRPGKLRLELPVELPRPRQEQVRYTPEFGELARQVREAISTG
jgi:NitT/TauT family transport system ATP-binding protein